MSETARDETTSPATILVIEDEEPMRRLLRAALTGAGYRVLESVNGADGLRDAATHTPEVVLIDLGLPDLDGTVITRRLREWSAVPVIVLSARGRERDKVDALDAGADDYVTKPFAIGELLARVRSALRRSARSAADDGGGVLRSGPLEIDFARHRVALEGAAIKLTPLEFKLLAALARHPGRVITHAQLLREVWGPAAVQRHHYVRVFMAQLRQKIEPEPSRPRWLLNEPGVGYRFGEGEAATSS
jgi:two-component system KDP operon response regulator KdpE